MKVLLAFLLCVLLALTALAISGGPQYPGGTNIVGVYAGVMRPKFPPTCPADPLTCPDDPPQCSANSLGVFSVGVPTSGISTGTFVMFSQGRVFSGKVQGVADPGKSSGGATLRAVLTASLTFTVTIAPTPCPPPPPACTPSSFTEEVTATANGNLDTHITTELSRTSLGATSTRLVGSATIDISHGQVQANLAPEINCHMVLRVRGFKQTATAPTSS